jgi:hypothetical protein
VSTVYIAGPISYGGGVDQATVKLNLEAFHSAELALRAAGLDVINPALFAQTPGKTWADYMREGVAAVLRCDMVAVLPGWECSKGALLEAHVAHALGVPVVPFDVVLKGARP